MKKLSFRNQFLVLVTIALAMFSYGYANEKTHKAVEGKEVSIEELKALNQDFIKGSLKHQDVSTQRKKLSKGQAPHTIIVTCSDSRVAPEYIFNQGLGEFFVVRTAGNVIDSVEMGSIEYAAEHLGSKRIIIMGHTSCGAVTAAMKGTTESPYINSILYKIFPAVEFVKSKNVKQEDMLLASIYQNVKNQIVNLMHSLILTELIEKHELTIYGAIYDLESGKVEFIK